MSLLTALCSKYIIVNLGMSKNFGNIDFDHLVFPTQMRVDYIRVYQDVNAINIGCNPEDFPTEDYINQFVYSFNLCMYLIFPFEDTLKRTQIPI